MNYIRVATTADFGERHLISVRVLGRPVAIMREPDGTFRAIEAGCKHQNADITRGHIDDGVATCPWHGWKYDLRTGACLWGSDTPLRPYACKVEDGVIYISSHPLRDGSDCQVGFVPFE